MKRKIMALLMAAAMGASMVLSACSSGGETTQTTTAAAKETAAETKNTAGESKAEGETAGSGLLNETGYPIVNEPITLKVGVKAGSAALDGPWADYDWIKALQEQSGINFEFVEYADNEAVSLMFASRDYPDISFDVGNDKQIKEAAEGGDLYAIDEYMEQYAPNWYKYFQDNPRSKATVTSADGHIYSLPAVWDETKESGSSMRDVFVIATPWLDELGLEIPTTTNEFYEVLKAFKEHAGEGSIPENVIPLYIYGITNNVGGALDLINFFGVRVSSHRYCVTMDDNEKVEFNFANEDIKEPLKYIRKLVEEGLVPVECFTDSNDEYLAKIKSADNYVGACFSGVNRDDGATTVIGVLDSENGKKPMKRGIEAVVTRNRFTIYKNCEYPEAAVRLANLIAEPEWSIQGYFGMFDGHFMEKTSDGKFMRLGYPMDEQRKSSGVVTRVSLLCSKENVMNNLVFEEGSNWGEQMKEREIYDDYLIPGKNCYPNIMFSDKNASRISELYTDIKSCVDTTFADWMINGGIDEGWDAYIAQLKDYGLEEFLSLLQEERDSAMALVQ